MTNFVKSITIQNKSMTKFKKKYDDFAQKCYYFKFFSDYLLFLTSKFTN